MQLYSTTTSARAVAAVFSVLCSARLHTDKRLSSSLTVTFGAPCAAGRHCSRSQNNADLVHPIANADKSTELWRAVALSNKLHRNKQQRSQKNHVVTNSKPHKDSPFTDAVF